MKTLGVAKDTPVLCYDSCNGAFACMGATLLSEYGVSTVCVLNTAFKEIVVKSEKPLIPVPKHHG